MRIVVLGATGNLGTALVERLVDAPDVTEVVGVARRLPRSAGAASPTGQPVRWVQADVRVDDLDTVVTGADAVVHLAWMFQPARRPEVTWETNALGTARVLESVTRCGVPHVLVASSVAAYSPRQHTDRVDEGWPTHGTSAATYAREKAYVERLLDDHEDRGAARITRLRPAFVFQRRSASEQWRIFAGPLVPQRVVRPGLVPVLPLPDELLLQTVHAADVADATVRAIRSKAAGAFNLCADDVLRPEDLAGLFGARRVKVPAGVLRGVLRTAWGARLVPTDPRLLDALLRAPLMSNQRAREELGWTPAHSAEQTLAELLAGLRHGSGHGTEPLHPA
jgi:nucleoside-diphosphate-sugar epimerase